MINRLDYVSDYVSTVSCESSYVTQPLWRARQYVTTTTTTTTIISTISIVDISLTPHPHPDWKVIYVHTYVHTSERALDVRRTLM